MLKDYHADHKAVIRNSNTIEVAVHNNQTAVVDYLIGLEVGEADKKKQANEVLFLAAIRGHLDLVKHMLKDYHADHKAVIRNSNAIKVAAFRNKAAVVDYLISLEVEVVAKKEVIISTLKYAIELNNLELFKHLILTSFSSEIRPKEI